MSQKYAYVTGKFARDEGAVREVMAELMRRGYSFPYDWTAHPVSKPFADHLEEANAAAEAMLDAVVKSHVVIVLMSARLWGGLIECGAVMLASVLAQHLGYRKRIYLVGRRSIVERSIFAFHRSITRCRTLAEVWQDLDGKERD